MINIPTFDTEFKGKTFRVIAGNQKDLCYTCVGYGDSTNAPYFIGMRLETKGVEVRSFLMRDILFIPS